MELFVDSLFERFDFQSNLLFQELNAKEYALVSEKMEDIHIKKGSLLFYENGIPTGIFLLLQGRAKKFKRGFDGKEQIFYIYIPGDILGYHALLGDERYQDSCEAIDDLQVKFISKGNFMQLLGELPVLKDLIIKNISHEFGVLANTIAMLAQKDQNTRLALNLLVLENRFSKGSMEVVGIDLSRENLANIIGTSKESLGRSLKQLREAGYIEIKNRVIYLSNKKALIKELRLEV